MKNRFFASKRIKSDNNFERFWKVFWVTNWNMFYVKFYFFFISKKNSNISIINIS